MSEITRCPITVS
jgi:hypothetical protein